jgi:hypothetical protein
LGTTAIAARLGLSMGAVHRYKKLLGVQGLRILPEKEILKLLAQGVAPRPIAERLAIPYRRVRKFAHAHGFGRPRPKLSAAQKKLLTADILARETSAMALAKKYKASYHEVLRMAHEILACKNFLPSWRTPLSSYFPSRAPLPTKAEDAESKMNTASIFVEIVSKVAGYCDGKLPRDLARFVAFLLDYLCRAENLPVKVRDTITLEQWVAVRSNFAAGLVQGLDIFLRDRHITVRELKRALRVLRMAPLVLASTTKVDRPSTVKWFGQLSSPCTSIYTGIKKRTRKEGQRVELLESQTANASRKRVRLATPRRVLPRLAQKKFVTRARAFGIRQREFTSD